MADEVKSFLPVFERLASEGSALMDLVGDTLVVEPVVTGPATKEITAADGKKVSLILESQLSVRQLNSVEDDRPLYVRVLMVGKGYYNAETGADVPLDVKIGDILMIGKMSVRWLSTFGPLLREGGQQVGICREVDKLMHFKGQAGFDGVNAILASAVAK